MNNLPATTAVVEYIGTFPERNHGNAKRKDANQIYLQTKCKVKKKTEVSFGTRTGKNVVPKANRGAVDDHDRQRNEKQLRNLKYLINREKTKVSGTNAAENITKVEEMTKTHSFVKTVKYIRDVSHPVVTLITDQQIVDLKFSCDPNNLQRPIRYKTIDDGQSIIFGTDIYTHKQHNKGI